MTRISSSSKILVLVFFSLFFSSFLKANGLSDQPRNIAAQKQPKHGFFKKIAIKMTQKRINRWLAAFPMPTDSTSPCAKIELKTGQIIEVELANLNSQQVSYRPCGNKEAELIEQPLSIVQIIIGRNGDILYGQAAQKEITKEPSVPMDTSRRCGRIVYKSGKVEDVALANWEDWGVTYRPCNAPEDALTVARFEELETVVARNGDVLYKSNGKSSTKSAAGPLLLVVLSVLVLNYSPLLICFGMYLSAKRLRKLKKDPNAKVGNKKLLIAALVLGALLLVLYVTVFLPIFWGL